MNENGQVEDSLLFRRLIKKIMGSFSGPYSTVWETPFFAVRLSDHLEMRPAHAASS
jgi:hypothetical protein